MAMTNLRLIGTGHLASALRAQRTLWRGPRVSPPKAYDGGQKLHIARLSSLAAATVVPATLAARRRSRRQVLAVRAVATESPPEAIRFRESVGPSIVLSGSSAEEWAGDALVLFVRGEGDDATPVLEAAAKSIDDILGGTISVFMKEESFEAKSGSAAAFPVFDKAFKRVVLVGLGDKDPNAREVGAAIAGAVKGLKGGSVGLTRAEGVDPQALMEGLLLGLHADKRFQGSKTPEKDKAPKGPNTVELLGYESAEDIDKASAIAAGVVFARELVNAPANIIDPITLTAAATDMAKQLGLSAKILDEKECGEMGMGSFLAVSRASNLGARLIHLTYSPGGEVKRKVGIVGKGLTFDSGGYNLKAGAGSMIEMMKFDMGGSASTLGAAAAIAQLKPKDVEVHFVIATCENMVSGNPGALHPGDIITAMDGTTIEVKSRDGNRLGCPFSNLGLERVDMGGSFHMIPLGFLVQDFSQYDSVRLFCALNLWLKTFPPPYTSYYILLQQAMRYTSFLRGSFLATCHVGVAEFACVHEVCPWEATGTASSSLIQVSDGRPRGKAKGRQEPEVTEEVPAAADDNILREELRNVRFNPFRRFHQVSFTVMIQVLIAFVAFGASRSMRWYLSPKGSEGEWTATWTPRQFLDEGKRDSPTYIPLDVDIYGAAVSSCIRDMQVLSLGSHHNADESIRSFRVVASLTMLWACMAAQGFISYMVASELSSVVVLKFRRLYDSFEVAVYAPESLTLTSNGFHRGIPAGFQPVGFADLAPSQMHTICQMPFANDMFLLIILFIWTLSCVVDLRRALCMLMDFTVTMPVAALKDATVVAEGDDGEVGEVTIVGIPMEMRAFLTAVIFIPRLVLDFVILFLGCRWLLSTSDMGDLILNAVALEFLLVLNSLVLQALVPVHGVNGLERTKAISSSSRHESAVMALLATLSWALFASSWCIFYVYFIEDVLPDYQWDVHAICNAWQNAIRRSK